MKDFIKGILLVWVGLFLFLSPIIFTVLTSEKSLEDASRDFCLFLVFVAVVIGQLKQLLGGR
jgi:hypothetical protein